MQTTQESGALGRFLVTSLPQEALPSIDCVSASSPQQKTCFTRCWLHLPPSMLGRALHTRSWRLSIVRSGGNLIELSVASRLLTEAARSLPTLKVVDDAPRI